MELNNDKITRLNYYELGFFLSHLCVAKHYWLIACVAVNYVYFEI